MNDPYPNFLCREELEIVGDSLAVNPVTVVVNIEECYPIPEDLHAHYLVGRRPKRVGGGENYYYRPGPRPWH